VLTHDKSNGCPNELTGGGHVSRNHFDGLQNDDRYGKQGKADIGRQGPYPSANFGMGNLAANHLGIGLIRLSSSTSATK